METDRGLETHQEKRVIALEKEAREVLVQEENAKYDNEAYKNEVSK